MEEEKKAKKALAAWTARRKAVTDEMHALLDVWRLTPTQREREAELVRELDVIDAAMPPSLTKRRKRKKKRKKRLPRTCGRAHHRIRLWHAPGWFSVFPSYVGRPMLVGILVILDQDDSFLRARRRLRQWHMLDWFGGLLLALCSLLSFTGPRCSASWPILTRWTELRIFRQWHVQGWFYCYSAPRAVFLSLSAGPP